MKIALNIGQDNTSGPSAKTTVSEAEILTAQGGDWVAKNQLAKKFLPLIMSLARKRSDKQADINAYVEAGQAGLFQAAKKYRKSVGPEKFPLFCLDYIQSAMDRLDNNGGGFWAKLFSR